MKSLLKKILPWRLVNLCWHLPKAILASCIYGFPARKLKIIAIAGTKGKTSTAYFLSHILDVAGVKHVLLSTAALKIAGKEQLNAIKLTSPTPFFLQKTLRTALNQECTHAILEVSSHAIKQFRVWGIFFDIVVLTNLMSDHLEYHANANEYRAIHKKLISQKTKLLVLNGDDPNEDEYKVLPVQKIFTSQTSSEYTELKSMHIPIIGDFNFMNILAAIKTAKALGVSDEIIKKSLSTIKGAPGRMEYIKEGQSFDVIVDYAHSVDSLTAFFTAIQQRITGKLIVVFGACGDRDPSMRAPMGQVLDKHADVIIVTNDDTYSEDPEVIASQLLNGITKKTNETFFKILDRRSAIKKSLTLAHGGDTVCILGKGSETLQILGTKKIPWDDREIARELLNHARTQER